MYVDSTGFLDYVCCKYRISQNLIINLGTILDILLTIKALGSYTQKR